jgi:TonB family protein
VVWGQSVTGEVFHGQSLSETSSSDAPGVPAEGSVGDEAAAASAASTAVAGMSASSPDDVSRVAELVHAQLAFAAARCYPPAARRYRLTGTVLVAFCVNRDALAEGTHVEASSGASLLDSAALGCVVSEAGRFPTSATGRCFSVPVRFVDVPR